MKSKNKIILITGTRKGIGKYLAEYYTTKGHTVIGCSRSSFDNDLKNYKHFCLDICDEKMVKDMFIGNLRENINKPKKMPGNAETMKK